MNGNYGAQATATLNELIAARERIAALESALAEARRERDEIREALQYEMDADYGRRCRCIPGAPPCRMHRHYALLDKGKK